MKFAILDSGPLISLTLNGLLDVFEKLKKRFPNIEFVLTPQVKREVVEKGMSVKKYELEAIRIQSLLDRRILRLATDFVKPNELDKETAKILRIANSSLKISREFVKIVHEGEASCLAFSNLCNQENVIVIDERVTRLLTESPENLIRIQERKLHMSVSANLKNLKEFKNFKFIRSSELLYVAYKNNLLEYKKDKQLLDALLYSVKFSGTAITSREIEEIKSLV